jgi:hypothetical protein
LEPLRISLDLLKGTFLMVSKFQNKIPFEPFDIKFYELYVSMF